MPTLLEVIEEVVRNAPQPASTSAPFVVHSAVGLNLTVSVTLGGNDKPQIVVQESAVGVVSVSFYDPNLYPSHFTPIAEAKSPVLTDSAMIALGKELKQKIADAGFPAQ